jgi:beta-lactamase class C
MQKVTRRRTALLCLLLACLSGIVVAQVATQSQPTAVQMSSQPAIAAAPAMAAHASGSPPPQKTMATTPSFAADARDLEALAQDVVDRAHIPGMALVIVQDGQILSLRGFGVTDTVTREAISPHTVFRLASLSKAFAGTLTALLVRDGSLRWDSRVANELPAFKLADLQGTENLTVKDILSQRAGLVHNTYDRDLESDEPFEVLVQRLAGAPMACAPGDCYAYQNIAFALIGDIVFTVTGDFYTHQVVKRIFQPLGMYDASFGRDGLELSPSWARPHVHGGGGWVPVRAREAYYRIPPAAGVNVSAHDMAQWLLAQMGHRPDVLPEDLLAEVHTPLVATPGELHGSAWRRARLSDAYYGIGWRIYNYAGHTLVFHGGAVQGFRSMIAMLPDRDIGAVVLWNSESPVPSGFMPTLLDRALGLPYEDWLGLDRLNEVRINKSHGARSAHKARKARARRKRH